jgi:5,10-methylene-tetrahydrofolate dehydrogenase/methenyl tetrahydrofolate cyclohydrolase
VRVLRSAQVIASLLTLLPCFFSSCATITKPNISSTPIKTVMVIGASGSVGPPIVEALLASGFSVSALTRASSNSTFAAGTKVVKADYSPDSLLEAFKGQDAVISTIATFSTQR